MANKTNPVKIGNEHFKTWLKRLDPVARVEKMSAIAKTQASAGLKGSLIKASLAQLSQRCYVMLMKLNDEEIKFYSRYNFFQVVKREPEGGNKLDPLNVTRKPSVKRLHDQETKTNCKPNDVDIRKKHLPSSSINNSTTNEPHQSSSTNTKHEETSPSPLTLSIITADLKDSGYRTSLKRPKTSRLEERYKELFGDFDDGVSVVKSKVPRLPNACKNVNTNKANNVVSTTVNVNIYNSPITEGETTLIDRRTHSEQIIEGSNEALNNRLRIDVSLSENGTNFVEARAFSKKKRQSKTGEMYKRRKKQRNHNHSSYKKLDDKNSQIKSDLQVLSALHNDNSDDDTVKELWKIFGMESPTDRSENIIKSYPQSLSSIETTSNEDMLNVLPTQSNEVLRVSTVVSTSDSISSIETATSREVSENLESKTVDQDSTVDLQIKGSVSVDKEPFCKISETFSLAKLYPDTLYDEVLTSKSSERGHENLARDDLSIGDEIEQHKSKSSRECFIETISLSDDEEDLSNVSSSKSGNDSVPQKINDKLSKIGTIRVKNLGLLLDPQKVPGTSSLQEIDNSPLEECDVPPNGNQENTNKAVQNRFFNTYRIHFNELVESKILKLGELLHLAVSDEIRKKERIKRAEQLSSSDLIKEEIDRANKDFNEMMRVRGIEFAPLVDIVLKKFAEGSEQTLFLVLFIRIFERAKEIDIENGNHIMAAKEVISKMLHKILPAHKEISSAMCWNEDKFMEQVRFLTLLLRAFRTKYSPQNNDISSKDAVSLYALATNPCIVATSQEGCGSKNTGSPMNINSGMADLATITPVISARRPSVQSENLVDHSTRPTPINSKLRNEVSNTTDNALANPILEHVDTSKYSTFTMQPQNTGNKAVICQLTNLSTTVSSISNFSSNPPNSTLTAPRSSASTKVLINSESQNRNLDSQRQKNITTSRNALPTQVTHSNFNHLTYQQVDFRRPFTNGTDPNNYIDTQQNHQFSAASNDTNTPSPILGLLPNPLLTPSHSDHLPNGPHKVADGKKRRSSASKPNTNSSGVAPAVHGVSNAIHYTSHRQPSNSLMENNQTNYSNSSTGRRQPTSNFRPHISAKTNPSSSNNMSGKMSSQERSETQLKAVETSGTIDPRQGAPTTRRFVRYISPSVRRIVENRSNSTNLVSLQTQFTTNSNQLSSNTTSVSIPESEVTITTANGKAYSMKRGVIRNISTDQQSNVISASRQMNGDQFTLVENSHSSNLLGSARPINSTSIAQPYSSSTESPVTQVPRGVLIRNASEITTYGNLYPVNVVSMSSNTRNLQERAPLPSTNPTAKEGVTHNSRTENVSLGSINLLSLLQRQSDSSEKHPSPKPSPLLQNMLTNAIEKSASQQQVVNDSSGTAPFHSPPANTTCSYMNYSVAGTDLSAVGAVKVGSRESCGVNQAIQSSRRKTISETPLMQNRPMPAKVAPAIYHNSATEPASSVSRITNSINFGNQQPVQSTATISVTGSRNPVVTSNPSSPRETNLGWMESIQPDLAELALATNQSQSLPTSSHCHPFIRRMPISGKMKMFFGNK